MNLDRFPWSFEAIIYVNWCWIGSTELFLFIRFSCFYCCHTFFFYHGNWETNALVDNASSTVSKWGINELFGLRSIDSNPKVKHDKFMLFFFTFTCRDNIDECIKSWMDLTTIFRFFSCIQWSSYLYSDLVFLIWKMHLNWRLKQSSFSQAFSKNWNW